MSTITQGTFYLAGLWISGWAGCSSIRCTRAVHALIHGPAPVIRKFTAFNHLVKSIKGAMTYASLSDIDIVLDVTVIYSQHLVFLKEESNLYNLIRCTFVFNPVMGNRPSEVYEESGKNGFSKLAGMILFSCTGGS